MTCHAASQQVLIIANNISWQIKPNQIGTFAAQSF